MKLKVAFYYHIPITIKNKNLFLPGFLGLFINSLAKSVDKLYLLMHKAKLEDEIIADCKLESRNIVWINLGYKGSAFERTINSKRIINNAFKKNYDIDVLIVRAPTPLGVFFYYHRPKNIKIVYLIVGDYFDTAQRVKIKNLRDFFVKSYLYSISYYFNFISKKSDVIVNSPSLYQTFKPKAKSTKIISTTNLSAGDFYNRIDTCQGNIIRLLYVGRIDLYKGLNELIKSISKVKKNLSYSLELHIVGWEDNGSSSTTDYLKKIAGDLGLNDQVYFHGYVKYGKDLNEFYRMSDIFIMPTYFESFPRTIFEAMANSLPVISTDVGSIPYFLKNEVNSLLIKPKNYELISSCIIKMVNQKKLRKKIIEEGRKLATRFTQKEQMKLIVKYLEGYLK